MNTEINTEAYKPRKPSPLINEPKKASEYEFNISILEIEVNHILEQISTRTCREEEAANQDDPIFLTWLRKANDALRYKQNKMAEMRFKLAQCEDRYFREIVRIVKEDYDHIEWEEIEAEAAAAMGIGNVPEQARQLAHSY